MADCFQILMMAPSKGRDYVTIAMSIFVKCGKCRFFANPVTYVGSYSVFEDFSREMQTKLLLLCLNYHDQF